MGNYTSSNKNTNPLGIPDSHFDKYGLNNEKTVLVFKTKKTMVWKDGNTHQPTGAYDTTVVFLIPHTNIAFSQPQKFECSGIHVYNDCYYFYDKNIGYIEADTQKTMNSLMEKYNIQMKAVSSKPN